MHCLAIEMSKGDPDMAGDSGASGILGVLVGALIVIMLLGGGFYLYSNHGGGGGKATISVGSGK
jgi:hypothetical protein